MASTPVASRQYGSVQSTRSTAAPVALLDTLLQGLGRLFIASTDHSSVITARARLGIWLNLRSSSRKPALSKWRTFTDERATQVSGSKASTMTQRFTLRTATSFARARSPWQNSVHTGKATSTKTDTTTPTYVTTVRYSPTQ
ncbi:hypothetical protein T4B_7010 [Trichinella pseudospiralis]|uniref:Uncharacterized protein n=1 Tax=Trichinella pseudospiralis TaxID=6337 RepID=A0A0V1GZ71_TRIPS|nr:hypothetical protein T4B_7010 [Trichinella pseudospiralis]